MNIPGYTSIFILILALSVTSPIHIEATNYTTHAPIVITSDNDFVSLGFPGTGTESDPYRIEGYSIIGDQSVDLLSISSTTSYVVIQNNQFESGDRAIVISNAQHVQIINNIITNNANGAIVIGGSDGTLVLQNTVDNNNVGSIEISSSDYCNLTGNYIAHTVTHDGIFLAGAMNTIIYRNALILNNNGINIRDSNNSIISFNDINFAGHHPADDYGNNNTFYHNYWSEWTSPDENSDGIVDSPFVFTNNQDNSPSVLPNVLVDVTPPLIFGPAPYSYVEGSTGHSLVWTIGDAFPGVYNATLDGQIFVNTASWSNGSLFLDVDGFTVGDHVLTLYVYDKFWNVASSSVTISVLENPDLSHTSSTNNTITSLLPNSVFAPSATYSLIVLFTAATIQLRKYKHSQ